MPLAAFIAKWIATARGVCELVHLQHFTRHCQYVRESLRAEEANRIRHACKTTELAIWTSLDTGLRVSETCSLTHTMLCGNRVCQRRFENRANQPV